MREHERSRKLLSTDANVQGLKAVQIVRTQLLIAFTKKSPSDITEERGL